MEELISRLALRLDLGWSHEEPTGSAELLPEPETAKAPPRSEIEALYEWARLGDVLRIEERVAELRKADEAYAGFADKVRSLTDDFRIQELKGFLAGFLDREATQSR